MATARGLEPHDYAALREYGTPAQQEAVDALVEHRSGPAAARALGIHSRKFAERLERLRKTAAASGCSPSEDARGRAPAGYHVRGKSTLYDADGLVRAQWVKTQRDRADDRIEALREAVDELRPEFRGRLKPVKAPARTGADLMSVIPLGDPHVGLYCHHEEVGENFDLSIARELMHDAVERLVAASPPSALGVLINLGDFFHSDSDANVTARSHHSLDVDGRWAKVLRVGIAAMRHAIDRMLLRHAQIRVINCMGNHDDQSSVFLSLLLAEAYSAEPRVQIDTSPTAFHYLTHGKVLIGATHGHTVKPDQLPGIMATDRAQAWGETEFRHWYVGHVHHRRVQDYPGCTVEYCRSLVARDAWTTAAGYRAHRDMRCVVWHKDYGEVEAHRVGVEQLA